MKAKFFYLIHIQYLGFRYHGWAKQTGLKTVHEMVDKTVQFVLGHDNFRTLGSSRTDARVSAEQSSFELFLDEPINCDDFLKDFNYNLPSDINGLRIEEVDEHFNIIQTPKIKEYIYIFGHQQKAHPFSSSLVACFPENLDIELMKKGALLFEGQHNFKQYCTKPNPNTQFERDVLWSRIEINSDYTASFFPEETYIYRIRSKGFMRNQVRLMMGQLLQLGRGEVSLETIRESLINPPEKHLRYIAPSSGLTLNKIEFED